MKKLIAAFLCCAFKVRQVRSQALLLRHLCSSQQPACSGRILERKLGSERQSPLSKDVQPEEEENEGNRTGTPTSAGISFTLPPLRITPEPAPPRGCNQPETVCCLLALLGVRTAQHPSGHRRGDSSPCALSADPCGIQEKTLGWSLLQGVRSGLTPVRSEGCL